MGVHTRILHTIYFLYHGSRQASRDKASEFRNMVLFFFKETKTLKGLALIVETIWKT
jgi:hypothetical protein